MSNIDVRIVELPPMRVACVNGFGATPETVAFDRMKAWASAQGLLDKEYRLFGHNNPSPSPGSPNYGYDVWITVDESVQADAGARIVDFAGGLYAVTRLEVRDPEGDIPATWQSLVRWMESSQYRQGRHQWLEEHIGPLDEMAAVLPFTLDLYLPIAE